jgi:hypothetical protein
MGAVGGAKLRRRAEIEVVAGPDGGRAVLVPVGKKLAWLDDPVAVDVGSRCVWRGRRSHQPSRGRDAEAVDVSDQAPRR